MLVTIFAQVYGICMVRKAQISSALELQTKYSELLRQAPYADADSPFLLHKVLSTSFRISAGVVKQWWSKYRVSEGEVQCMRCILTAFSLSLYACVLTCCGWTSIGVEKSLWRAY